MILRSFPSVSLKTKEENGKKFVWDIVRRKYVQMSPEEWVRQHMVHWLWKEKGYPLTLMKLEHHHRAFGMPKRSDVLVLNALGAIVLLCECKAAHVGLSVMHVRQAVVYNYTLHAPFVLITNGNAHVCLSMSEGNYNQIDDIPPYSALA